MSAASFGEVPPVAAAGRRAQSTTPYSLRDLITSVFYHKRAMFVAFLVPCVLALAVGLRVRPTYVAQARLLVLNGSDYVFHPTPGQGGSDLSLDRNQIVQGELQILQSSTLAADVLRQIGLTHVYPQVSATASNAVGLAARRFADDLTVSVVPLSSVIELGFANRDPMVAAEVLKVLIEQYLHRRTTVFGNNTINDVTQQLGQFAEQVHRAEQDLARFGAAHGISNIDEQTTLLLRQLADNRSAQSINDQAIREITAKLAVLRVQLANVPETVKIFAETNRTHEADAMADNLVILLAKQRDLRSRYRENFPLLADITRQIDDLRAQMNASPSRDGQIYRSGRNAVYDELRGQQLTLAASLSGLEAKREELGANAVSLRRLLDDLAIYGQEYRDLQRNRDVLDESFRAIERSTVEAQQAAALERLSSSNIRVVQPPEAPSVGRNPRAIILAGGVGLGLLAAGFTVVLSSAFRQVMVTVHDAETALDLPVLAAVQWRQQQVVARPPSKIFRNFARRRRERYRPQPDPQPGQ